MVPEAGRITVEQVCRRWHDVATKPNTRKNRDTLIANLGPWGEMPVARFDKPEIQAWLKTLAEGRTWYSGTPLNLPRSPGYGAR